MPPLWLLPMPWRMSQLKEEDFWQGRDLTMGEELELGPPPLRVQLEEAGQRVPWGPEVELAEEGSPLAPLGPGLMEVDGTEQALEDGATVGEAADKETDSSLPHASPWKT